MLLSCPLLYANSKEVDSKLRATEVFIDEISDFCVQSIHILSHYININNIVNGENSVNGQYKRRLPMQKSA